VESQLNIPDLRTSHCLTPSRFPLSNDIRRIRTSEDSPSPGLRLGEIVTVGHRLVGCSGIQVQITMWRASSTSQTSVHPIVSLQVDFLSQTLLATSNFRSPLHSCRIWAVYTVLESAYVVAMSCIVARCEIVNYAILYRSKSPCGEPAQHPRPPYIPLSPSGY
jgi:hypothetical protein